METVLLSYSPDHYVSPNRRARPPKRNPKSFTSRPRENFVPPNLLQNFHGGPLLGSPQIPSSSVPYSFTGLNQQKRRQPPLLPLPAPKPYASLPYRSTSLLCSPTDPTINRNKDQLDRTMKKSKSSTTPKKQDSKEEAISRASKANREFMMNKSSKRLGPDPRVLPREVSAVLKSLVSPTATSATAATEDLELSGPVFLLSPPPSSLPLPKFFTRARLSCNSEAGGVDEGATDNLRRLLRLP